jgi:putative hemolysin
MGSASVSLADGGHEAASIFRAAAERSLSPEDYRVYPRRRLPLESLCDMRDFEPPPLVKAYLNVGAWVSGEPAWDHATGCALLPILMPLARMQDRYARHFLAKAA